MKKKFLPFCILFSLLSTFIKAEITDTLSKKYQTLESIPNPKNLGGGYISDPDTVLWDATKTTINTLFSDLEKNTTDQAALVVVKSIGEEVPKDFANRLFNKWGVGVKGKNNGLLILMVVDQRRIEFETGYGMEAVLPDALCKRIQMNYMVPRFQEYDYDQGLIDGIKATVDILQKPENSAYFSEMESLENPGEAEDKNILLAILAAVWALTAIIVYWIKTSDKSFTDLFKKAFKEEKEKITLVISKPRWVFLYVIVPVIILLYLFFMVGIKEYLVYTAGFVYGYLVFVFLEKRFRANRRYKNISGKDDYYEKYKKYTASHKYWFWSAILFPVPFLFYVLFYLRKKSKLRNHPRNCNNCSKPLKKLSEKEDDLHLTKAQIMEETLNSVDYDVWYCDSCSSKQVLSYKNIWSSYSECKSCKTRAYYLQSDVTLEAATYESTGTGRKTFKCKYCGDINTESYIIAKKVASTTSSTSSSSSSYSSGNGGGGSSYGGGSSGGGGAGSSW